MNRCLLHVKTRIAEGWVAVLGTKMWWRWWCTQCSKRPRVAVLDTRWSGQISGVCLALFMLTIYAAMVVQVEGAGEGKKSKRTLPLLSPKCQK